MIWFCSRAVAVAPSPPRPMNDLDKLATIWRDIRFDRQPRISFETAIWLMRTVAYTIAPGLE